jgi:hypothetical protein
MIGILFLILALVCFLAATFNVLVPPISWVPFGYAWLVLYLLSVVIGPHMR